MPLQIRSSVDGSTARLSLAGELDGASTPSVRDAVDGVLQGRPQRLLLWRSSRPWLLPDCGF